MVEVPLIPFLFFVRNRSKEDYVVDNCSSFCATTILKTFLCCSKKKRRIFSINLSTISAMNRIQFLANGMSLQQIITLILFKKRTEGFCYHWTIIQTVQFLYFPSQTTRVFTCENFLNNIFD